LCERNLPIPAAVFAESLTRSLNALRKTQAIQKSA